MAIEWGLYQKIRRMYLVEGLSQRTIARQLNVSRKTIRKYCKGGVLPDARQPYEREPSELRTLVEGEILRLLELDKDSPKKQHMSASGIWRYLVNEKGYCIGETTVRKYVRELRNLHPEVFLPLEFEPGEVMEFDWGDMVAYIDEVRTPVSVFCSVLPYSSAIYAGVYPDKTNLSFQHGHIKAFDFFGGVPVRCMYDNLKSAVLKGSGKSAVKQEAFKRLEAHYGFEAVFCNRAAGWEKSAVENGVSIIRKIAFTPIPHVESFEALREHVIGKCIEYCQTHRVKSRDKSIWDMLKEEKNHLLPLPAVHFDPGVTISALVYPDLTVHYDNVKYSVPKEFVGQRVTLKVSPFEIGIFFKGQEIYRHKKALRKNDHQYVLEHYLDILERKPRAIPHAVPIKKGIMPQELKEFSRLYRGIDREKQMVDILLLGRKVEQEKLLWAVRQANNSLNPSYRLVCFYLDIDTEIPAAENIAIQQKSLKEYDDKLLKGGASDEHNPPARS